MKQPKKKQTKRPSNTPIQQKLTFTTQNTPQQPVLKYNDESNTIVSTAELVNGAKRCDRFGDISR